MLLNCFSAVVRTGWSEPTDIADERRDTPLIDADESDSCFAKDFHMMWKTWTVNEIMTSIKINQIIIHSNRVEWE